MVVGGVVRQGKGALQHQVVTVTGFCKSVKEIHSSVNPGGSAVRRGCDCCSCNTHSRNSQRQLWTSVSERAHLSMFAFGSFLLKIRKFCVDFLQRVRVFTVPAAEMRCVTAQKDGLKRWELVKVKSPSKTHWSKLPVVTPSADLYCHENQTAEGSHEFEL